MGNSKDMLEQLEMEELNLHKKEDLDEIIIKKKKKSKNVTRKNSINQIVDPTSHSASPKSQRYKKYYSL